MHPAYKQDIKPTTKTFKQRIMRRIYFVFMVRNLSPFAFDCLAIVIVAFIATLFVSVNDVLLNLSTAQNSGNLSNFSLSAFSATELQTKLLLVVLGAIGFFAVRHLKCALRAVRTLKHGTSETQSTVPKNPDKTQF
ncbi:MAG TPA: hypothetical protein DEF00_00445 [Candidatus Taylorbacteria bacterium]|nr:MAG: hypothetical protein UY03_C0011G0053 [Parcubacteria group bacterium GW2011_GWA2_47_64]KKU96949.1 MAG: hypothetical protein UY29_C0004G0003 [Parcubacteria group bacterium GW2011_GWC2_48_17]HBV00849.1 hypothetical protein [Candidatus Taylorbacteria bacterium]